MRSIAFHAIRRCAFRYRDSGRSARMAIVFVGGTPLICTPRHGDLSIGDVVGSHSRVLLSVQRRDSDDTVLFQTFSSFPQIEDAQHTYITVKRPHTANHTSEHDDDTSGTPWYGIARDARTNTTIQVQVQKKKEKQ